MIRTTLKGLFAHKLRLALTGLAIVMGVAFVSGTFVLTDTLTGFFDEAFAESTAGTDFVVSPATSAATVDNFTPGTERIPAGVLETITKVPGVATAEGLVSGAAQMLDKEGERIGGFGPPTLGFSWSDAQGLNPLRVRKGRPPRGPGEVVIDVVTARNEGFAVGDRIKIIPNGPVQEFEIVGLVGFGSKDNLGGATIVSWDSATAQKVLRREGQLDQIVGTVEPGADVATVVEAIGDALPAGLQSRSGEDAAAEQADQIKAGIGQLSTAILGFAGIALFVGAFIIANTFSIIIAQRARELALLRSLGASRFQVLGSVLLEALIVGVTSSVIGIGVGLGVGAGLRAVINSAGGGGALPGATITLQPRTVIVGLAVGTLTTLVSAVVPAVRGSRQPPVAALQTSAVPPPARVSARRVIGGALTSIVGGALLARGLYGDSVPLRFAIIGLGALGLFLGIALLSPLAARPVARILGAPVAAAYGITGQLARENSARNPQRTAATAAALMIGLALVTAVGTMGASIKASLDELFEQSVRAQVVVQSEQMGAAGVDPAVEGRIRSVDGVERVVPLRYNSFALNDKKRTLVGVPGQDVELVMDADVRSGALADMADGGIALHTDIARKLGRSVGDTMEITLPRGARQLRVDAIFDNNRLLANYVIALSDYEAGYTEQNDSLVLVATRDGAAGAEVAAAITTALKADYPQLKVQDQAKFREEQAASVNPLLVVVNSLLVLSILIAVLGITNTLALSVLERTRELGLLRAIGMGRRQMRRMVRWESVIISVLGAVLGIAVGIVFGFAIVQALKDDGISVLAFPLGTIAVVLVLSVFFGMFAAIFPARRAGRLDILQAISMD